MKNGDRVIWDSGFGYDLGYYVGVDDNIYNNVKCNMVTGIVQGISSFRKSEVIQYTEEKHEEINTKYKYGYHSNKSFNNSFN